MEYKLVRGSNEYDLVERVGESIDAGWAPVGGVAVSVNMSLGGTYFYQALTRSKAGAGAAHEKGLRYAA